MTKEIIFCSTQEGVFFFFLLTLTGSLQLQSLQWSRSLHLLVFWILFENVMSLRRTKAAITGLLEANCVNQLGCDEKLGNTVRQKNTFKASKKVRSCIGYSFHVLELIMGMFMLYCAVYDLHFGKDHFFIYLLLQAGAFFIMGIWYVGTFVTN
ncbi:hypothetical protein NC651_015962 [Populus alba x Populus x berolinensis]|nr:hypothetical protein NC651_015962 [Populus alba x Populus x berolinensis]